MSYVHELIRHDYINLMHDTRINQIPDGELRLWLCKMAEALEWVRPEQSDIIARMAENILVTSGHP